MAVNPYLLNQAANPGPAPIDSFLPAFRGAQDRRFQKEAFAQENEMRLAEMKMKWQEYVTKQRESQAELAEKERLRGILAETGGNYEQARDRLASEGFLDAAKDVSSFIPEPGKTKTVDLGDRVGVLDEQGNIVRTIQKGEAPGSRATNVTWMDVFDKAGNPVGSFPSGKVPDEYQGSPNYRVVKSAELTGSAADVGLEQKGGRDDARRAIAGMDHAMELIDQGLLEVSDSDTNTGIVGWAKRNVLDPVVQLADIALPEGVGQRIYEGADIGGATRVETVANFLSGQLLPAITGETSGRFTEAERAMAQRTIALLESSKSTRSVRQALQDVKSILQSSIARQQGLLGAKPSESSEPPVISGVDDPAYNELKEGDIYMFDGELYRKVAK